MLVNCQKMTMTLSPDSPITQYPVKMFMCALVVKANSSRLLEKIILSTSLRP